MFPNIHWTLNVHGAVSAIFPIAAHESQTYRKWLLENSLVEMSDELSQQLETQLQGVSDRKFRPYKEVKLSACTVDKLESETLGSTVYTRSGSFFKLSSRLALNQVNDIKKYFPNLASMEKRLGKFKIDSSNIADDVLCKTILTDDAKNFALTREILKADRDDTYAAGCEQYLRASIELGKIFYSHGGVEIRKLVDEKGDCLFHTQKYSQRMANLQSYVKKKKDEKLL